MLFQFALLAAIAGVAHAAGNVTHFLRYAQATWNCSGDYPPCPDCKIRVSAGSDQSPYGCAPWVAHTLVAGGFISPEGVGECGNMDAYGDVRGPDGKSYNLNVVAHQDPNCGGLCLTDYLMSLGWTETKEVGPGTMCAVVGSDGPYTHAIVGVGTNRMAAHNVAEWNVPLSDYEPNLCLNPPAGSSSNKLRGKHGH